MKTNIMPTDGENYEQPSKKDRFVLSASLNGWEEQWLATSFCYLFIEDFWHLHGNSHALNYR